jgi:large subunit ribosomal protein L30
MFAKADMAEAKVRVKLVRSLIGSTKPQLATARALGLRKIGDVSIQPDNAATKGKVRVLAHLLEVEGGAG